MTPTTASPRAGASAAGIVLALLLGLLAGFLAGRLAASRAARPGGSPPAAPASGDSPALARVGDDVLTVAEMDERWRQLSAEERSFHGAQARAAGLASPRAHYLEELVDEMVLAREARRRGLDERLDVRVASRACAQRIVSRPLLAREVREAALPRAELEAWYAQHSHQFGKPLRVQVREIVVTSAAGGGAADDTPDPASARAKAEDVLARARAGEDFAALASARSEAPSARYGGFIGWVEAGRISRAWEETALSLQPGETSDVLEIPEGFVVLKADAREEATIPPLDEVQDVVLEHLLSDDVGALQRRYNVFVRELRSKEVIEVRPELLGQDAPAPASASAAGGAAPGG